MRNYSFVRISTIALMLVTGCGGAEPVESQGQEPEAAPAQGPIDVVAGSPEHYAVMVDNDFVRVLRVTLAPGERDEMHTHPRNAWYSTAEGTLRVHEADGSSNDVPIAAGQVGLNLAGPPHSRENVGTTDLEFILFERRDRPTMQTTGAEALDVSPDVYSLLVENADFRVLDATLPGGTSDEPHGHRSSVFYIMSDAKVVIHTTGADPFDIDFQADTVSFQEVESEHILENVGDTDLRLITMEFAR